MSDPSASSNEGLPPEPDPAEVAGDGSVGGPAPNQAPAHEAPPHDAEASELSDEEIHQFMAAADSDGAAGEETPVDPLVAVTAERDGYLDTLQRIKAEFDNHRRRVSEQAVQQREQAAASLVEKLLPVLDACEAALAHDAEAIRPIRDQLFEALSGQGLASATPTGEAFDPEQHEAVLHEEADEASNGPVVAEVLRTGYTWNGRVLRPAMVKVRG